MDTLSLEVMGIKAGAEGHFAIVAVLLTLLVGAAGFAAGRRAGWW